MNSLKVAFYTLGCKLNFAETSTIERLFDEKGFEKVGFNSKADVVVINTCTVTASADKKCRNIISKAVRTSPRGLYCRCRVLLTAESRRDCKNSGS
jgi:threonylcarbamoyladenosine tRNA methylthiotransferase MtaB